MNSSLSSAIASVQGKTASARADSVDKVTTYEAKYRPLADKYNAWCVAVTIGFGSRSAREGVLDSRRLPDVQHSKADLHSCWATR